MKKKEEIKLYSQPYTAGELEAFPYIEWYKISSEEELVDTLKSYGILKQPPIEFLTSTSMPAEPLLIQRTFMLCGSMAFRGVKAKPCWADGWLNAAIERICSSPQRLALTLTIRR